MDNTRHASGLQDFVEGNYYDDLDVARVEKYTLHKETYRKAVEKAKRRYELAKRDYDKILVVLAEARDNIKQVKK